MRRGSGADGLWVLFAQDLADLRPRPAFMPLVGLAARPCLVMDPDMLVAANDDGPAAPEPMAS